MIEQQRQSFMRKYKLKPIRTIHGHSACIEDVLNASSRHEIRMRRVRKLKPMELPSYFPFVDHVEIFELTKEGASEAELFRRILIATSQPYSVTTDDYRRVAEMCIQYRCGIFEDSSLSWWAPPSTRLFMIAPFDWLDWLEWKGITP